MTSSGYPLSAVAGELRDAECHGYTVLQTTVDAQCNKMATVDGRIKLATLATADVL